MGSRVEKGVEIDTTPDVAQNFGGDLVLVKEEATVEEVPTAPKAVEDMTMEELRAHAKNLGLKTTGSKADLIERISLA